MVVATVLTVYGIETVMVSYGIYITASNIVATVLTVYGIETRTIHSNYCVGSCNSTYRLRY